MGHTLAIPTPGARRRTVTWVLRAALVALLLLGIAVVATLLASQVQVA